MSNALLVHRRRRRSMARKLSLIALARWFEAKEIYPFYRPHPARVFSEVAR